MIKMIASDLDGTLLHNYQQTVPQEILDAITRLHERGIIFVAASGRQYANIRRLFSPLGFDIPYIAENGSLCVYKENVLSTGHIPDQTIHSILDGLTEYRQKFHTGHCILSRKDTYDTDSQDERFIDYMLHTMRNHITYTPDLYTAPGPFLKAAICDFNGTKELEPFFRERVGSQIQVATSADHWIDFIAPDANKGSALAVLMEHFHIAKEECICFGDQQNDIEMLKKAGTSYAMSTASPEVVRHADHVIDSVVSVLKGL